MEHKKKKKILFIPVHNYLADPVFFSIAKNCDDFETTYINSNDPLRWGYDNTINIDTVNKLFDNYIEVKGCSRFRNSNYFFKYFMFLMWVKRFKKVIKSINPDVIITASDMSTSFRICSKVFKNIPLIIIQPSFLDFKRKQFSIFEMVWKFIFNKIFMIPRFPRQNIYGLESNRSSLFLWGEYFEDFYKKNNRGNIYLTGNPDFDRFFLGEYSIDKNKILSQLKFSEKLPLATICTQPLMTLYGSEVHNAIINYYLKLISDNPKIQFLVKIHPRENRNFYTDLFKEVKGNNYRIIDDINVNELFAISDVQISAFSYTSFQAVIQGVPIILINPENLMKFNDFFNDKIELRAVNYDELNSALHKSLTDKYKNEFKSKRTAFLKYIIHGTSGNSSAAIIQIIKDMLNNKK